MSIRTGIVGVSQSFGLPVARTPRRYPLRNELRACQAGRCCTYTVSGYVFDTPEIETALAITSKTEYNSKVRKAFAPVDGAYVMGCEALQTIRHLSSPIKLKSRVVSAVFVLREISAFPLSTLLYCFVTCTIDAPSCAAYRCCRCADETVARSRRPQRCATTHFPAGFAYAGFGYPCTADRRLLVLQRPTAGTSASGGRRTPSHRPVEGGTDRNMAQGTVGGYAILRIALLQRSRNLLEGRSAGRPGGRHPSPVPRVAGTLRLQRRLPCRRDGEIRLSLIGELGPLADDVAGCWRRPGANGNRC